jgi:DNA-binding Lrp family transcriptional regulator
MYLNRTLNATDRDVYGAICVCLRGRSGSIDVSQQEIGEFLNLSARQVRRSIRRLSESGALKTRRQRGGPSIFEIAFVPAARKRVSQKAAGEENPAVTCPKCHKRCHGLLKVGWCRSCNWKNKVRRIVREEMNGTEVRKIA